ncbi:MAG: HAD family hydrolase, partial [Arenimonas sp.]
VELNTELMLWRIVRPGIHAALENFKAQGIKLAIVSNADGRVEADAARYGLAGFFDVIIDSHVVGVEKPDPRIFQLALDRLGVAPQDARYAGDIYSIDMVGARAAGIEGRLIDQHGRYHWIDHHKIQHIKDLHPLAG